MGAYLQAIGVHIPQGRVSMYEHLHGYGVAETAWGKRRSGLAGKETRSNLSPPSLCIKAFENLKKRFPLDETKVDLVCVVSPTTRHNSSASAIIRQRLGLTKPCMTFDISQIGAGYTHGLAIVDSLMRRLGLQHALLFTCDPYSKVIDSNAYYDSLLFGDAATVSYLSSSGSGYRLIGTAFGRLTNNHHYLVCREMLRSAINEVPLNINALLHSYDLEMTDIDLLILHQASNQVVELVRNSIYMDDHRTPLDHFGNTASSSIPIALQRHIDCRQCKHIVLSGFGFGFAMASNLLGLHK